jgi:Transposase zinc-binding domain
MGCGPGVAGSVYHPRQPQQTPFYQLAYSCRVRCFCPSCHEKRALEKAGWVAEHVCAEVPHRQFVFTIPKRFEHNAVGRFPEPGDEELLAGPSRNFQIFDPLDFLAEVTQHIPGAGVRRGDLRQPKRRRWAEGAGRRTKRGARSKTRRAV